MFGYILLRFWLPALENCFPHSHLLTFFCLSPGSLLTNLPTFFCNLIFSFPMLYFLFLLAPALPPLHHLLFHLSLSCSHTLMPKLGMISKVGGRLPSNPQMSKKISQCSLTRPWWHTVLKEADFANYNFWFF